MIVLVLVLLPLSCQIVLSGVLEIRLSLQGGVAYASCHEHVAGMVDGGV